MHLTRTKVRELLDGGDLAPSRALGQNFLCDGAMIDKIVRLSGIGPGDNVIEIGPGLGSLTMGLCQAGANVVSIEIDRYLVPVLRSVVGDYERNGTLTIINQDVREVDWETILGHEEWTVVANLPYNIATPLILDLLAAQPQLTSWLVMVQREAGERLVAEPGGKIYGIPSVLVAYWATAKLVGSVGAELFYPKPNVASVLVKIERRQVPADPGDFGRLSELVRTAFGQRRKMLRRSLAGVVTNEEMEQAGIKPTARPEELGVEAWVALASVSP